MTYRTSSGEIRPAEGKVVVKLRIGSLIIKAPMAVMPHPDDALAHPELYERGRDNLWKFAVPMSGDSHEDPVVVKTSSRFEEVFAGEKRKSPSPPRDDQGEAKRSEPLKGLDGFRSGAAETIQINQNRQGDQSDGEENLRDSVLKTAKIHVPGTTRRRGSPRSELSQTRPLPEKLHLMNPEWMDYLEWFRSFGSEGEPKVDLIADLEYRNLDPVLERGLCLENPYSISYHFRQFFPKSQGGLNILYDNSQKPVSSSKLPLQIRRHAEELARAELSPERANVPLMRQHVILHDVLPSELRSLPGVSIVTSGAESTLTRTETSPERDMPRDSPGSQHVFVTSPANPSPKAHTESSIAPPSSAPMEVEAEDREKAAIRERLRASREREVVAKPERQSGFQGAKVTGQVEMSRAEENVYERLTRYFRYQAVLSLAFNIAKRRHNLLKRNPDAIDGYAQKMKELVDGILHFPLLWKGSRENRMVKYAANLYELYFEECDFDRQSLKSFMEADWKASGQTVESPQA
ncbi:hypothetical protein KFL_009300010 [Klebsormidium nitens]|uniref:Uncharacterized protein n=1 Tax=Klebsormidium nitens TaxID=105231 RepID=A0A1Y1IMY9_KLENI|nr:hypothetical protein KFL_009300010 [Klebsormidium nitens]|eukprot:GAQ92134.1 hypothetical protein KFL_009300010 [Klebsormidium nitens]